MKNKFMIKTRLTLWYIIILAFILIAFSSFIYWGMEQFMYREVKRLVTNQAQQIVSELEEEFEEDDDDEDEEEEFLSELEEEIEEMQGMNMELAFYDLDKNLIHGKQIDKVLPEKITSTKKYIVMKRKRVKHDEDWVGITLTVKNKGQIIGWIRLVRLLENEDNILNRLLTILILGIVFTLIIASSGGYFLAWKALSPIDRITRTAMNISHNNLSQRIEEAKTNDETGRLAGTLNQLLNRLEKAFEREKQFTADASHELRTPIAVIRAQAEKAVRNKNTKEGNHHTLKVIEKQAEYMSHLIDQLLLLARSDVGQQLLEREELDLKELIMMVSDEIKEVAVKKEIKIVTDIKSEEIKIYADQSMLIQLFLNLLDNAIKYSPAGGQVTVMAEQDEKGIKIKVVDTGVGISQKDQKNIFKRFYRVDKARSRQKGGTGLGLAICRWIVEAHGGSINVKSKEKEGTVFIIYFSKF